MCWALTTLTADESHLIDLGILRTWVLEKFGGYYTVQVCACCKHTRSTTATATVCICQLCDMLDNVVILWC
jgi:hypothetical protein